MPGPRMTSPDPGERDACGHDAVCRWRAARHGHHPLDGAPGAHRLLPIHDEGGDLPAECRGVCGRQFLQCGFYRVGRTLALCCSTSTGHHYAEDRERSRHRQLGRRAPNKSIAKANELMGIT
eukprot:5530665-Prymnesium_polylepis.1